jgi:23S rRNA pseudouridine2605 synthase
MRLNKYLSKSGVASRRESDNLIQMGTTEVNGKLCLDPAYSVKDNDIIKYDGKKIEPENNKYVFMLNKPKKVITTVKDTHGRRTVLDLVNLNVRVVPIGRLDQDTTGLLLLTNDGDLHQYLTHPKNKIPKDYEVEIEGKLNESQIKKISHGIYIGNREYGKAEVINQKTKKGRSEVLLRLRQGKKREIRRLMFRLKVKIYNLKRINFAGIKIGDLKIGDYRELSKSEIKKLRYT